MCVFAGLLEVTHAFQYERRRRAVPMSGSLQDRIAGAVRGLTPGYFALVMATGIISVGMKLGGHSVLSAALLIICAAAYLVLVLLTVLRLVFFREDFVDEFTDPRRAFGFFTFIAGSDVLGTRLAMAGYPGVTAVLLVIAIITWLVLGYVTPWTAVLSREDRPVIAHANGTWFIWVVASQSIAVTSASIEPDMDSMRRVLALIAVVGWSLGVLLYAAAGIFVAARMMLYEFRPIDLNPPYWVAMGAAAITVLAGARIVDMADAPMVRTTARLIGGTSVVFWAFGTWLIPVLIAAGVWRHYVHRIPLNYEANLWAFVFPLGMYAVSSTYLGQADHLPIVETIGDGWLWLAIAAWLVTFVAMIVHLSNTVIRK